MAENLDAIKVDRKSGEERFEFKGASLPFDLLEFWQWSQSGLLNNVLRGVLAEFIIAKALGINAGVRSPWDSFDLKTDEGLRIEVKSAAYLQSWKQKKYSNLTFRIAPTLKWAPQTNEFDHNSCRQAHVYIFCILIHKDKSTVNPLDLDQWKFYILKTDKIDHDLKNQKTLGFSSLLKLNPIECVFDTLHSTIQIIEKELC